MINFKLQLFYTPYPLNRKLGGLQSRYGRSGEEKSLCGYWDSKVGSSNL
jgi:hypothetical protein